jgi:hypothetical protein
MQNDKRIQYSQASSGSFNTAGRDENKKVDSILVGNKFEAIMKRMRKDLRGCDGKIRISIFYLYCRKSDEV